MIAFINDQQVNPLKYIPPDYWYSRGPVKKKPGTIRILPNLPEQKARLLDTIHPAYIVLKPSLHGGMMGCREWIRLARERGIGSWITSALESNVGLNAVAHFCAEVYGPHITMPQGLGTGLLYTDNIDRPLKIVGDKLWYLKNF